MKIGLMGGTFDPPHNAHINMAECAMKEYNLDKIMFMTGGNPPHKRTNTPSLLRHHMIKLAIADNSDFFASSYEIEKTGYSYTSDTLKFLREEYPEDEFYFIIGGDSFEAIFSWHEPLEILKRCAILVYPRNGKPTEKEIEDFNSEYNSRVFFLHAKEAEVSSSDIRREIADGRDMSEYLNSEVWQYIKRNLLYAPRKGNMEDRLKNMLNPKRYEHSIGVASTAVTMAGIYGADAKKAYVAGLLHDCAKNLTDEQMRIKCCDLEVVLDEFEEKQPWLIHAKLGAELVKIEFGIEDEEICSAIRWHTLGRPGMSMLEKIIYVADMVEPSRSYPEVDKLRKKAFENLDEAVLACAEATVEFNEKKGKPVHPNAYKIIKELKNL